jgi:hypothetical protein
VGRFIGILAGILVLFWIISSPETAAATVANIIMILKSIADSIISYVQGVTA